MLKITKEASLEGPGVAGKIQGCIEDLSKKGYAKKAAANEIEGKTWYLPHHAVFHPAKPGKGHVIFDCSAKYRGISLNNKLLQGLDLTTSLIGVMT